MSRILTLLLLAACTSSAPKDDDTDSPVDSDSDTTPTDDGATIGPGEVRAGEISDPGLLFGGIASEGREGDIILRNDRVRFIVQGMRDANYYVTTWGGVIDADVVRPDATLGQDIVEKWAPMIGLGRIMAPVSIEVVDDGADSGVAHVRVEGIEAPLDLLEGAIEAPGFVSDLGLTIVQDYRLSADSWMLDVTTTVNATREVIDLPVADVLFGSPEASVRYTQTTGISDGLPRSFSWTGYAAQSREVVAAVLAPESSTLQAGALELIASLADVTVAGTATLPIDPSSPIVFERSYGVAPDLATLTDVWLARSGVATTTVEGTVTAPDGPVAGAWVHVLVDDDPYTVATTRPDGSFSAQVPEGSAVSTLAVGRRTGRFVDVPTIGSHVAPYAHPSVASATLSALQTGTTTVAPAEGRGFGSVTEPLALVQPGIVRVSVDDDLPFTVFLDLTQGDPPIDQRLVQGRPGGHEAAGWSRGGPLDLAVEPGSYNVLVHRGMRFEIHEDAVTVAGGDVATVEASLAKAYEHPGWLLVDPHSHATPSGDGGITMEDRLVVTAATGVQAHFGTDHDHVADYRPVVAALGLSDVLTSIPSDEVSPPLRGHFNIYPVEPDATKPNGGAWSWWLDIPETTDAIATALRQTHGDDFVMQVNHPLNSGMAESAGWSAQGINRPDFWTNRFQALEVLNDGNWQRALPLYLDLVSRGKLATPTGVSDSHNHFGGRPGMSATFLGAGTDDPRQLTDEALLGAMGSGRTIVTRGPFIELSVPPGSVVGPGTELTVTVRAPSWIMVDRILLVRDTAEERRVQGTTATFTLDPDQDAAYTIIVEGDRPMAPVDGNGPWAMSGAILVDVDGDGWDAPREPFPTE